MSVHLFCVQFLAAFSQSFLLQQSAILHFQCLCQLRHPLFLHAQIQNQAVQPKPILSLNHNNKSLSHLLWSQRHKNISRVLTTFN